MKTYALSVEDPQSMEILEYANQTREALFDQLPGHIWNDVTTKDVKKVILILSSSRSGSSLLFEILKKTGQVLCLDGEHVPNLKLNCFGYPDSQIKSDQLDSKLIPDERYLSLSKDILADLRIGPEVTEFNFHDFAPGLAMRLAVQWPHLKISASTWLTYIFTARERFQQKHDLWESTSFLMELFEVINTNGHNAPLHYYDVFHSGAVDGHHVMDDLLSGPPCFTCCIEEPPFVLTCPRRFPTAADIQNKPILLKASIDAYRFPFIKKLFPNAQIKIIHLTRNPAASINGIYDGWRYDRGFFSHNLSSQGILSIPGYSDLFDWGKYWWKFDLPPGWETQINSPLEYVCGFQWYSAHKYILESISSEDQRNVLRIKFEDLLCSEDKKQATMAGILNFIEVKSDASIRKAIASMPLVMVTHRPLKRRWQSRKEMLWPVISQKDYREISEIFQYSFDDIMEWL